MRSECICRWSPRMVKMHYEWSDGPDLWPWISWDPAGHTCHCCATWHVNSPGLQDSSVDSCIECVCVCRERAGSNMSNKYEIYSAPNLKSKVWKSSGFFKKNGKLDKSLAICKFCRATVKNTGSRTVLSNHLARWHGGADAGEREASAASTASTTSMDKSRQKKECIQPQFNHNSAK